MARHCGRNGRRGNTSYRGGEGDANGRRIVAGALWPLWRFAGDVAAGGRALALWQPQFQERSRPVHNDRATWTPFCFAAAAGSAQAPLFPLLRRPPSRSFCLPRLTLWPVVVEAPVRFPYPVHHLCCAHLTSRASPPHLFAALTTPFAQPGDVTRVRSPEEAELFVRRVRGCGAGADEASTHKKPCSPLCAAAARWACALARPSCLLCVLEEHTHPPAGTGSWRKGFYYVVMFNGGKGRNRVVLGSTLCGFRFGRVHTPFSHTQRWLRYHRHSPCKADDGHTMPAVNGKQHT